VKTTEAGGVRGYNAGNIQDYDGARLLLRLLHQIAPSSQRIWVDSSYGWAGLAEWMLESFQIVLEIVKRNPEQRGFAVLLRGWVVCVPSLGQVAIVA